MPEQIAAKYFNKKSAEPAEILARATGLEPVTYGLTANLIGIKKNFATPQESGLFSCWSDV